MVCCLSFIEFFSPSNDAIPVGARRLLAQTTVSLHWIYSSNVSRKKQSEKMPPSRLHIPTHILSTPAIRFLSIHRNLIQIHLQRLSAHSHQTSLTQRCHRIFPIFQIRIPRYHPLHSLFRTNLLIPMPLQKSRRRPPTFYFVLSETSFVN